MTDYSAAALRLLAGAFEAHRDVGRASAMTAYMRDQFPFLGIPTPQRRQLQRSALSGIRPSVEADLRDLAVGLWALSEREYQYAGCDILIRHVRLCGPGFLDTARELITTRSWWDTVDALASRVVGPLVAANPQLAEVMDRWVDDGDIWVARTAVLHQLGFKGRTDEARLFAYCLRRAPEREFFIRKAIGWALREYSKVDAGAVRSFVADHDAELSGLSKREALLWLNRRRSAA